MKFASLLLLIITLAAGPISCKRENAPDQNVSANTDESNRSGQPQPDEAVKDRNAAPDQAPRSENLPANREPDRTSRSDQARPADRNSSVEKGRVTPAEPQRERTETVPKGTPVTVVLADAIATDKNQEGDTFTAHLAEAITVDGNVVANKGAQVTGHIVKIDEPGRVKGKARLEMVLDEIQTRAGTHKLSTEPFTAVSEDTHGRDAAEIAGGAGVGAAIGAIAGGKKGAAIGAIIGGGTGTTTVLLTKGKQLQLEPETKINFVLSQDVDLPVVRTPNT
jgi:hypothetical protein